MRYAEESLAWVWNSPKDSRCILLPLQSNCLPQYDEFCRRALNFISGRLTHLNRLISFVASCFIKFAQCNSISCRNMLFYTNRYNCSATDDFSRHVDGVINSFCSHSLFEVFQTLSARILTELPTIRDSWIWHTSDVLLSLLELRDNTITFAPPSTRFLVCCTCFVPLCMIQ